MIREQILKEWFIYSAKTGPYINRKANLGKEYSLASQDVWSNSGNPWKSTQSFQKWVDTVNTQNIDHRYCHHSELECKTKGFH